MDSPYIHTVYKPATNSAMSAVSNTLFFLEYLIHDMQLKPSCDELARDSDAAATMQATRNETSHADVTVC